MTTISERLIHVEIQNPPILLNMIAITTHALANGNQNNGPR